MLTHPTPILHIATRASPLALWQAQRVFKALEKHNPKIQTFTTSGDRGVRLWGKNSFTKEIHGALLEGSCQLAVHSLKDVPPEVPDRLVLAAVLPRHYPRDVLLLSPKWAEVWTQCAGDLKLFLSHVKSNQQKITLGSSSLRRRELFTHLICPAEIHEIRGNVQTRIQKHLEQNLDFTLLAHAGLQRLGLFNPQTMVPLDPLTFIPAPGQGVIAIEMVQNGDISPEALKTIGLLNHIPTSWSVALERLCLEFLQGGCQSPIGIYCDTVCVYVFYRHPTKGNLVFFYGLDSEDYLEIANICSKILFFYQWEQELKNSSIGQKLKKTIKKWI